MICVITVLLAFTLPKSFNFISYFIPVIYACNVFSKDGKSFNVEVLIFLLLLSIVIPTGFFTLDTSSADKQVIIAMVEPSLNIMSTYQTWINLVVVIIAIVIPIGVIVYIVGDMLNPLSTNKNYNGAIQTVLKMATVLLVFFVGCYILDYFGLLPSWFAWRYIRDFIIYMMSVISWLGDCVAHVFGQNGGWSNFPSPPAWPNFGNQSLGEILANPSQLVQFSNDLSKNIQPYSPIWFFLNVNAAIPLVLAIIPVIMWVEEKQGKNSYFYIDKYMIQPKDEDLKIQLVKFNGPATIFGIITLIYAFGIFLTYNNSGIDISLYLVITIFCLILIITGILPVKTGNVIKVLEGTVIGIAGVFFFYNLISSGLSMIPFDSTSAPLPIQIFNQVFFVAPTESLIFQIAIPGLGLLATYYIYKHFKNKSKKSTVADKIITLTMQQARIRELYNQAFQGGTKHVTYRGKSYSLSMLSMQIFNLDNQIKIYQTQQLKESTISLSTLTYSKISYTALVVCLCFILPNVIFSSYHSIRSGISLLDFWITGRGFIYFGAGCWITFITLRYGWLSAILTHAGINIISILLLGCGL